MKALTLWQPYASLMFALPDPPKTIETRSFNTTHRGLLAIHAAKAEPAWVRQHFMYDPFLAPLLARELRENTTGTFFLDEILGSLPRGEILGTVELFDVKRVEGPIHAPEAELALGDYSLDRRLFYTRAPRKLVTPIPFRGAQRLWELPDTTLAGAHWHE